MRFVHNGAASQPITMAWEVQGAALVATHTYLEELMEPIDDFGAEIQSCLTLTKAHDP